jgi:PTS system galactitol-specific IIA component
MGPVELCVAKLDATSADAVLAELARRLLAAGHVRDTFERAAQKREKRSPTGLPFVPIAVALPHAEPEHVLSPGIAIASLARPVRFRQMGSPATLLDVELVVMPALTAKEQAGAELAKLIELLQDATLRQALTSATSDVAMKMALEGRWGTGR